MRFPFANQITAFLLLAILSVGFSNTTTAEDFKQSAKDKQIALAIADLMRNMHLSKQGIDDTISKRALGQFTKALDPMKVYFLKSDIEEFSEKELEIDDMIKDGNLTFSFTVFNRFLKRIDERVKVAVELIDSKQDFTVDEEITTDPETINWANDTAELNERWRKRVKYNILVMRNDKTIEKDEINEKLKKRYTSFQKRMGQFDSEEVIEMYLTAMTTSFDPHSTYFSKSTFDNFMIQMRLKLEGIGASLQSEDGVTVVKRIVPGGAAEKHGKLAVEDKIVSVGQGENGEMNDVRDMKLDDVVKQIRGKAGTVVRLGVISAGSNDVKVYNITREKIELKDSEAQGEIFEAGTKDNGKPYKMGVIDLPSFYSDMQAAGRGVVDFKSSTRDTKKLIEKFKETGVDALILDLRSNGGGSLPEAIDLTGLFVDTGPIVQVKNSRGSIKTHYDQQAGTSWDGPLVVVTSKFSASASEILAGAVQDYKRGLIVGDSATHGKGTVQQLRDVAQYLTRSPRSSNRLGALKVTLSQFYRPGGASTQKKGVAADIVLPSFSDHMDVSEDDLDFALEFDEVRKARFPSLNMIDDTAIKQLTASSESRVKENEKFKKLEKDIERYRAQKAKKSVTLNEEKFLAQRKEFDADEEDKKTIEDQVNGEANKIKRDFYMEEVLSIAVDYVKDLKKKNNLSIN